MKARDLLPATALFERRLGRQRPPRVTRVGRSVELGMVASGAAIGGAVVEHFLDPDRGHARRARLRDETAHRARLGARRFRRVVIGSSRRFVDHQRGILRGRLRRLGPDARSEFAPLADRIRSQAFGYLDVDHSSVSLEVADGVVTLRGEVESPAAMTEILTAVETVRGVKRVRNLLHQAGEDPPNKVAALRVTRHAHSA